MTIVWKSVVGYEGLYEVSSNGEIRRDGRVLKSTPQHRGHLQVPLCKHGVRSTFYIHRLVLEAFVGPCPDGMECRHLDGDPANNKLKNLCWGTPQENAQDKRAHGTACIGAAHTNAKLTTEQAGEIRRRVDGGERKSALAREFHVSDVTIGRVVREERYA